MTQEKGEIAGAKSLMGERESGACMQGQSNFRGA